MTRPTPCQKCKADLERARARIEELVALDLATAYDDLNKAEARIRQYDEKCLANASSYDDLTAETNYARRVTAEARVREMEAELDAAVKAEEDAVASLDANWVQHQRIVAAEQKLADANALIAEAVATNQLLRTTTKLHERLVAHLAAQPAAPSRTEAGPIDCESCAMHGRICDGGDHCDNCGALMDGDIASTADVCFDCWQAAKGRTEPEQAVLDAMAACTVQQLEDCIRLGHRIGGTEKPWGMVVAEAELARRGLK